MKSETKSVAVKSETKSRVVAVFRCNVRAEGGRGKTVAVCTGKADKSQATLLGTTSLFNAGLLATAAGRNANALAGDLSSRVGYGVPVVVGREACGKTLTDAGLSLMAGQELLEDDEGLLKGKGGVAGSRKLALAF